MLLKGNPTEEKRRANNPSLFLVSDTLLETSTCCHGVVLDLSVRKTQFEAETDDRCAIGIC